MVSSDGVVLIFIVLAVFAFFLFGYSVLTGGAKPEPDRKLAPAPPSEKKVQQQASHQVFWLPQRFVVVDLETTGLKAETHRITQVGAIKVTVKGIEDGAIKCDFDEFTDYVYPEKGSRITAEITQLTGITRDLLKKQGRQLAYVLNDLNAFCEGLPMVAFNAEFDQAFLKYEHARASVAFRLGEFSCALKAARAHLPGHSSYRLSNLCEVFKIRNDKPHDALHDAKAALEVYILAMTAGAAKKTRG